MPSRKSAVSTTSNGPEDVEDTPNGKTSKETDGLSVEDLTLPKSMIARLAKGVLPPNTQIHKDALLALHKSATVFVSYIASHANEQAQMNGKKTIAPTDVRTALKDAEFSRFLPKLDEALLKYNGIQSDKRNNYRLKVKENKAAVTVKDDEDGETQNVTEPEQAAISSTNGDPAREEATARPTKKLKRANGDSLASNTGSNDVIDEDAEDDASAAEGHEEDAEDEDDDEVEDEEDEDEGPEEEGADDEDPESRLDPLGDELRDAMHRDEALDEYDHSDSD